MPKKYHILKEYANGVMDDKGRFFPYRAVLLTSAGTLAAAKNGTRYFVKQVSLAARSDGVVAAGYGQVKMTLPGESAAVIANVRMAAQTQATDYFSIANDFNIMMLSDEGTAVTFEVSQTSCSALCVFAQVDEVSGEYSI